MSRVMCHLSGVFFFFLLQIVGSSRWRVCYQQDLSRLVLVRRGLVVQRLTKDVDADVSLNMKIVAGRKRVVLTASRFSTY